MTPPRFFPVKAWPGVDEAVNIKFRELAEKVADDSPKYEATLALIVPVSCPKTMSYCPTTVCPTTGVITTL
jgi:hypothetical protein